MNKLRDEFFEKHVSHKTSDGIPVVSTHPHNLFEWFEKKIQEQELPINRISGWIGFQGNEDLFNEEAKKNCKCLFEDGTEIYYNDDHPMEIMTHFKLA